jgi:hypothetical protein
VKAAAVVVERANKHIQFAPNRQVGRSDRGLGLPDTLDERLEVVHPAQAVLRPFERAQIGCTGAAGQFGRELEGVPQLLERDAHNMQPLRQVDRSRSVYRSPQSGRAPSDAGIHRPPPYTRSAGRRFLPFLEIVGDPAETLGHTPQRRHGIAVEQPLPRLVALLGHRDTDPAQSSAMPTARNMRLVNQEHEDV